MAAKAKSPDQVISADGSILAGVPALAISAGASGVLVAAGFAAAELGSIGLRTTIGAVESFASKGMARSAFVRGGIGSLVVIGAGALMAMPMRSQKGAARAATRKRATKAAILMELGVLASAAREYVGLGIGMVGSKLVSVLPKRAGGFTPNYSDQRTGNVLPLRAGASALLPSSGGAVGRFGGPATDTVARLPRAGGDAGFEAVKFIDPNRITRTEIGMKPSYYR